MYGAHTENLFHMAPDQHIIGVSINDTRPSQVHNKPKFSYHDGPEKFIAFQPDLVLIRPMIDNGYANLIKRLEQAGIVVISLQPSDIEEMFGYWKTLGMLTGSDEKADRMISEFKTKINKIRSITQSISPKKRVYFEAIHQRMKTFTDGAMPMFALKTAGGINIATDARASRNTNIAIYGKERILSKASQIDVFLAQRGVMNNITVDHIKNEPGFHIIKAVKEDQVYLIEENIISRPVPALYEGILAIGQVLYPDIFNKGILKADD